MTDNTTTPPSAPSPGPSAPSPTPAAKAKVAENTQGLARVLLVVLVVVGLLGGLYALVATMSALSAIGVIPAFVVALLPVLALPLFLSIRAGMALKRRGQGAVIRRLVSIALILLTHLAIIGVVAEWVGRSSGDLFATSYLALEEVGGIPYISPMLKRAAKERNALPLPGDDAPPATLADGGPAPTPAPSDGGPAAAGDGVPSPPPAEDPKPAASDAGVVAVATAVAPTGDAPPLSPRQDGGARVLFAASSGRDDGGNATILAHSLYAKGSVQTRRLSLAAFRADGSVRQVETANDGHLAVLLSSGVVLAAPPAGALTKVPALTPGAKVSTPDGADAGSVTSVRDVVVGPGGDMVAVVDVAATRGKAPSPALVTSPINGATATLIRQRGDGVDALDSAEANAPKAFDFGLRRGSGSDRFVLVETFVVAKPIRTKLSGKIFEMNPQRLLVGSTRAPAGMREVARTGASLIGIQDRTLQAFQDAVALADGRVLFDANFAEDGKKGWVFVATPGDAQAYAVAPKRFPTRAPWSENAPRARALSASDDVFAFIGGDADKPSLSLSAFSGEATTVTTGATAYSKDGTTSWRVLSFQSVALADTADWALAHVILRGEDGKERGAIVLASAADIKAKAFEVIAIESTGASPISRLMFRQDRRDALWMVAP